MLSLVPAEGTIFDANVLPSNVYQMSQYWGRKFDFKLEHLKNIPFPRLELLMENLETCLDFRFDHIKYSPTPKLKLLTQNLEMVVTLLCSGRLPSRWNSSRFLSESKNVVEGSESTVVNLISFSLCRQPNIHLQF